MRAVVYDTYGPPGTIVPVIGGRYPLSELAAAIRYLGEGKATGKVVIDV